jgi:hypothetical protein
LANQTPVNLLPVNKPQTSKAASMLQTFGEKHCAFLVYSGSLCGICRSDSERVIGCIQPDQYANVHALT